MENVNTQNAIEVSDIDTVYITAAGYIREPFTGIGGDSSGGWEDSFWGGDLTRSNNGIMTNIDDVNFGFVARCDIVIPYMNAEKYMKLRKIARQRHFKVDFFNRDTGTRMTRDMAFTKAELGKLHSYDPNYFLTDNENEYSAKYIGARNVTITMVGTNLDMKEILETKLTIKFNNGGNVTTLNRSYADNIKLPNVGTKWVTKSGDIITGEYLPNQDVTVYEDMIFYKQS